jgi:hypothetical protein
MNHTDVVSLRTSYFALRKMSIHFVTIKISFAIARSSPP